MDKYFIWPLTWTENLFYVWKQHPEHDVSIMEPPSPIVRSSQRSNGAKDSEPKETTVSTAVTMISGTLAATCASTCKQPLVRLKWIRQVSEQRGKHATYTSLVRLTVTHEGIQGLWRGTWVSICRNVPHAALTYSLYPKLERRIGHYLSNRGLIRVSSGILAAVSVSLITHPLDTLRVRVTTQAPGQIRYHGMFASTTRIYAKEGISAFYRGLWPTILGAGPRGGIGFGIFETLKAVAASNSELKHALNGKDVFQKLFFGGTAGTVANLAVYPLDTVRRRLQTFGHKRELGELERALGTSMRVQTTRGVWRTIKNIVTIEGFRGLYKGAAMTMIKSPVSTGVSFCVNDIVKFYLCKRT